MSPALASTRAQFLFLTKPLASVVRLNFFFFSPYVFFFKYEDLYFVSRPLLSLVPPFFPCRYATSFAEASVLPPPGQMAGLEGRASYAYAYAARATSRVAESPSSSLLLASAVTRALAVGPRDAAAPGLDDEAFEVGKRRPRSLCASPVRRSLKTHVLSCHRLHYIVIFSRSLSSSLSLRVQPLTSLSACHWCALLSLGLGSGRL